mgnify:CR=1 FL=1
MSVQTICLSLLSIVYDCRNKKHAFPFHKVGGNVRYNLLECEKFMELNKKEYA